MHDYDFGRNTAKYFHLERNRLLMVAANYERSTLARLAPALLGTELALLAVALRGGWRPQQARGRLLGAPGVARGARAAGARRAAAPRARPRASRRRFARRLGPEFGEGVARASAGVLAAYARVARLS